MKLFGRKNKSQNLHDGGDFGYDDLGLDGMDFENDYDAGPGRDASLKSKSTHFVKQHYKDKLDDRNERKKLMKKAMPSSYSPAIGLADDVYGDLKDIKYEVGREWDKQKGHLKKLLKQNEGVLKLIRAKKLQEWANESERSRYEEEQADQTEALVQNLLADFTQTNQPSPEEMRIEAKEKEADAEIKSKTLTATLQNTANSTSIVAELRKQTAYQDSITFKYQQKNLEFNIRNYVESKKQTEILQLYKDESLAELKEIHKNTGLPEAVKINQSELAGQIFKERMIGNIANWADRSTQGLRTRVVTRIKSRLTEMVQNFGSTIGEMASAGEDQEDSGMVKMLLSQMFGGQLDKPYEWLTDKVGGKIRRKMEGNSAIARFGRTAGTMARTMGSIGNDALIRGSTGNKFLDEIMFNQLGLQQAGQRPSDTVRNNLEDNLDVAQYMDTRFKQTVERVIPGWLGLIHKENYLIRTGMGFSDKGFKTQTWSWKKEGFTDEDEIRNEIEAKLLDPEKIKAVNTVITRMVDRLVPDNILSKEGYEKVKKWVYETTQDGLFPNIYWLACDAYANKFGTGADRTGILAMASKYYGLHEHDLEAEFSWGHFLGILKSNEGSKLGRHVEEMDRLAKELTGKRLFNPEEIQKLAQGEYAKHLEEAGYIKRGADGSLIINRNIEAKLSTMLDGRGSFRTIDTVDGTREVKGIDGKMHNIDNVNTDIDADLREEHLNRDIIFKNLNQLNKIVTRMALDEGFEFNSKIDDEEKFSKMINRAMGGYIPSFAKGGRPGKRNRFGKKAFKDTPYAKRSGKTDGELNEGTLAIHHGGEYISDHATTENNEKLLEEMNRLKAPVFLPDGSPNPIYYEAMGYKTAEEFKEKEKGTKFYKKALRKHYSQKGSEAVDKGRDWIRNGGADRTFRRAKVFGDRAKREIAELAKTTGKETMDALKDLRAWLETQSNEKAQKSLNVFLPKVNLDKADPKVKELILNEATPVKEKLSLVIGLMYKQNGLSRTAQELASNLGREYVQKFGNKLKRLINGSDTDTRITDAMGRGWNSTKNFASSQLSRTALGNRYNSAKAFMGRNLQDVAVDIYSNGNVETPVLTAIGFGLGHYIDKETGRICETHHDITGEVIDKEGNVILSLEGFKKGFCDKEGNTIEISSIKRIRNIVRNKIMGQYNQHAKKHVDQIKSKIKGKLKGKFGELKDKVMKGWGEFKDELETTSMSHGVILYLKDADTGIARRMFSLGEMTAGLIWGWKYDADGKPEIFWLNKYKQLPMFNLQDWSFFKLRGTEAITDENRNNLNFLKAISDNLSSFIAAGGWVDSKGKDVDLWRLISAENKIDEAKKKAGAKAKQVVGKGKNLVGKGKTTVGNLFGKMKDKVTGKFKDEDGNFRVGSWSWKRKQKEEAGWLSRLGSAIRGNKDPEKAEKDKKKWWRKLIFGGIGLVVSGLAATGKLLTGALTLGAGFLVKKMMGMFSWFIGRKLLGGLLGGVKWLGLSLGRAIMGKGLMGNGLSGLGKIARVGGAAMGGYMLYKGLKGQEQYDANGDPILDENGKPVVEKDYAGAAMGAATMAMMIPGAGGALMSAGGAALSAGAALLTNPIGWAVLGAAAAGYAGYKAWGWWKRRGALKEKPLSAFRMIQYGFSPTDEEMQGKIMQLETVCNKHIKFNGEQPNFSNEINAEEVFGVFGLSFEGGDPEKTKRFCAWLLGRFKPVFLSYVKQMQLIKGKTDISTIDEDLSQEEKLKALEGVHFKTKTEMNPYNFMVHPTADDKLDYDYDDVCDKYDDCKSNIEAGTDTEKQDKSWGEKSLWEKTKTVAFYGSGIGLVVGAAKLAVGAGKKVLGGLAGLVKKGWNLLPGGSVVGKGLFAGAVVAFPAVGIGFGLYAGLKKLGGWMKGKFMKGKMIRENPLLALRMGQYGYEVSNQSAVEKLIMLEGVLSNNLVVQGESYNISPDFDANSVLGIFGLKYEDGTSEQNKTFMTWFLGRFKPVYLAWVKQLNVMKKTYQLGEIDKLLKSSEKLEFIQKIHFSGQNGTNPYNVMHGAIEGKEVDLDFEAVAKLYDKVKAQFEREAKMENADVKTGTKETDSADNTDVLTKVAAVSSMGIAGGAISTLAYVAKKTSEIFGFQTKSMSETMQEKISSLGDYFKSKWDALKGWGSGLLDDVKNSSLGQAVGGAYNAAVDVTSQAIEGGANMYQSAVDATSQGIEKVANWLNSGSSSEETMIAAAKAAGITNPTEIAMLLAQAAHETGGFKKTTESLKYSAPRLLEVFKSRVGNLENAKRIVAGGEKAIGDFVYGGRMGNSADEGFKYRGRGFIQLTGKSNYVAFSKWAGVDAVNNPDIVSKHPYSSLAAVWYWLYHPNMKAHNARAAAQRGDVNAPTKAVNGGLNGLNDRASKFKKYLELIQGGKIGKSNTNVQLPASSAGASQPTGATASTNVANALGVTNHISGMANSMLGHATAQTAAKATGTNNVPAGPLPGLGGAGYTPPANVAGKPAAPNATLAALLQKATPELIAAGKTHYRLKDKKVVLNGMNETFMTLFWAMLGEAKQKGCGVVQINDGFRSLAEQHRLYNLYKAGKGSLAAKPGTSRHGFGQAMDINTVNANELIKKGVFEKWGFTRPLLSKGETWHIENKHVPRAGAPSPSIGTPNKDAQSTVDQSAYVASIPGNSNTTVGVNTPAGQASSNPAVNSVITSGSGYDMTNTVANQQRNDAANMTATNDILSKQLGVQTEIRDALITLKDFIVNPAREVEKAKLEALKQPQDLKGIGEQVASTILSGLTDKLGTNTPAKPQPPISVSK